MIGLGIPVPDSYNISRTKGYKWDLELALNPEKAQTKSRKFIVIRKRKYWDGYECWKLCQPYVLLKFNSSLLSLHHWRWKVKSSRRGGWIGESVFQWPARHWFQQSHHGLNQAKGNKQLHKLPSFSWYCLLQTWLFSGPTEPSNSLIVQRFLHAWCSRSSLWHPYESLWIPSWNERQLRRVRAKHWSSKTSFAWRSRRVIVSTIYDQYFMSLPYPYEMFKNHYFCVWMQKNPYLIRNRYIST